MWKWRGGAQEMARDLTLLAKRGQTGKASTRAGGSLKALQCSPLIGWRGDRAGHLIGHARVAPRTSVAGRQLWRSAGQWCLQVMAESCLVSKAGLHHLSPPATPP
ncbi:hypothetical protein Pmani_027895 [Petrolisthes manimaculis]|uniref:Uncharacterized protein n=1 Tax=Petrolisthes manimaculis TaxID=1843537 RepID=A0AAE1P0G6_9EUCA|nr:hypothetical protein Pmani_027895 [Petrolisthes manimaculis]